MSEKRTVWVLDTETKGTGAEMVPLERLERERNRPKGGRERIRVISRDDPKVLDERRQRAGERRIARRFKIVDVRSREALAEDVGLAEALETLRGVGSVVDVNVFIRHADDEDWHR